MKRTILVIGVLLLTSGAVYSQVGIATTTPKATLDVVATSTAATSPEGIIAPRLTRIQLTDKNAQYTGDQTGAIVYVTDLSGTAVGKAINVTKVGYYYFDGTFWQAFTPSMANVEPWFKVSDGSMSTSNTDNSYLNAKVVVGGTAIASINEGTSNAQLTVANGDASINGVTVGTGKSNIATNTAVGSLALSSNSTGSSNTAVGSSALTKNAAGLNNTAVGGNALQKSTGNSNTAVGNDALGVLSSGDYNVAIGYSSAMSLTTGSNNIALGASADLPATASNQMNIGNLLFGTDMNGTLAAPTGKIGIGTTSPAAKLHINGDLIVGAAASASSNVSTLVRNNTSGLVGVIPQLIIPFNSVAAGATLTMDSGSLFYPGAGHIVVSTGNGCGRYMTAIFNVVISHPSDFGLPIVYLNSMGRDIVGVATKVSNFKYQVKFPGLTACNGDGDGTMFDFTIDTSVGGKISITNNGNVTRSYSVRISQIL